MAEAEDTGKSSGDSSASKSQNAAGTSGNVGARTGHLAGRTKSKSLGVFPMIVGLGVAVAVVIGLVMNFSGSSTETAL